MSAGCPCGKRPSGMQVRIGGQQVGLAGLAEVFEEWSRKPDGPTPEQVLAALRRGNYIRSGLENEYVEAVRGLYSRWLSRSR
jgi:hypothetical protein